MEISKQTVSEVVTEDIKKIEQETQKDEKILSLLKKSVRKNSNGKESRFAAFQSKSKYCCKVELF